MPVENASSQSQELSFRTRVAFYAWLALLLISLATFAIGISGHIVTLLAAPWLSLKTQAIIHTSIPVLLTAVKFITVPLLVLLTPFACRHPTFRSWTDWSKSKFRQLEGIVRIPAQAMRSLWSRLKGANRPR